LVLGIWDFKKWEDSKDNSSLLKNY
jgi:hypothetical protein